MAWNQSGNIRGASGVPGASGASGPPGATGPVGPTGATGASGGTGGTGGPGTTSWNDITDKPGAILNYKGTWNASTNTPTLSDSTGSGGDVYRVSVGGSRNLGSGTISWEVGDYAIWSPVTSSWEKADTTDAVSSVAGRTGAVTLTSADLGASGTASASTFLRGDNTWATGPIGATGASGGTGATGGTGAAGVNYSRDIATLTAPTTLGASGSTDYVRFLSTGASGDVHYSSVTALLSGDGTNNSTTITDSSSLASNWTASGNAKLNTTTKKFGTASISFDDTSGTFIRPSAAASNFTFGTSDWTIEFWAYLNNTNNALLIDFRPSGTSNAALGYLFISYESGPKLVCGSSTITGSALSTTTWHHIAASRAGTSLRLFVGGTQVGSTATNSTDLLCGTNRPMVGNDGFQNGTGDFRFNGFIDDLRITKGVARYTANFTAPTAAFETFAQSLGTPTLPAASVALGRYSFRNISGSTIIIGASGSQQINGATGGLSLANGSSAELMSNGTGWFTF